MNIIKIYFAPYPDLFKLNTKLLNELAKKLFLKIK